MRGCRICLLMLLVCALDFGQAQAAAEAAARVAQTGVEAAQKGDYGAAISAYKQAIGLDPSLPGLRLNSGSGLL